MAKSTTKCRKGCPVFEDWQKMEAETAAGAVIAMQAEIEELKADIKHVQATSVRLELERNEMEAQLHEQRWRKVSEELPEEMIETVSFRSENVIVTDGKQLYIAEWWTRQKKWNSFTDEYPEAITHWMPIPTLPIKGTEE